MSTAQRALLYSIPEHEIGCRAQATEAFKRVSEAFVNLSNRMSRFLILTGLLWHFPSSWLTSVL